MRILVTAATRHGATGEIADALAAGLERRGIEARRLAPGDAGTLAGYDAVVLGSAVYMGRWLVSAREFALRHAVELAERPVWLFSSGPLGDPPLPAGEPDVGELVAATGARGHRTFPGLLERERLSLAERLAVRAVHAPYGDSRDWGALERFADEIAAALAAEVAR